MISNYYPPEGHDWIGTNEIRRLAEHNAAQAEEKYIHDAMEFRQRFFDKLIAHGAIDDGFGWAIFGGEDEDGSVATLDNGEVLLASRVPESAEEIHGHITPLVRLITNELIVCEGTMFYLTEDTTLDQDNHAQYYIDAVDIRVGDDQEAMQEAFSNALKVSKSPIFHASEDNKLHLTLNAMAHTPIQIVTDPTRRGATAAPFGFPNEELDKIYALSKANMILDSVIGMTPASHYTRSA